MLTPAFTVAPFGQVLGRSGGSASLSKDCTKEAGLQEHNQMDWNDGIYPRTAWQDRNCLHNPCCLQQYPCRMPGSL